MSQIIHKPCKFCKLAKTAYTVCLNGYGSDNPKLLIFLDNPSQEEDRRHKAGEGKYIRLVIWMMQRMSIPPSEYRIEYTIKCHAEPNQIKTIAQFSAPLETCGLHRFASLQKYKPRSVVGLGRLTCKAFTGSLNQGDYEGTFWPYAKRNIWIGYNPAYAFQNPSEALRIYRVIYAAAVEAELKPKFNPKTLPFDFEQ